MLEIKLIIRKNLKIDIVVVKIVLDVLVLVNAKPVMEKDGIIVRMI